MTHIISRANGVFTLNSDEYGSVEEAVYALADANEVGEWSCIDAEDNGHVLEDGDDVQYAAACMRMPSTTVAYRTELEESPIYVALAVLPTSTFMSIRQPQDSILVARLGFGSSRYAQAFWIAHQLGANPYLDAIRADQAVADAMVNWIGDRTESNFETLADAVQLAMFPPDPAAAMRGI